jgi:hypothetical protein
VPNTAENANIIVQRRAELDYVDMILLLYIHIYIYIHAHERCNLTEIQVTSLRDELDSAVRACREKEEQKHTLERNIQELRELCMQQESQVWEQQVSCCSSVYICVRAVFFACKGAISLLFMSSR